MRIIIASSSFFFVEKSILNNARISRILASLSYLEMHFLSSAEPNRSYSDYDEIFIYVGILFGLGLFCSILVNTRKSVTLKSQIRNKIIQDIVTNGSDTGRFFKTNNLYKKCK
jgi:hypothetical protein